MGCLSDQICRRLIHISYLYVIGVMLALSYVLGGHPHSHLPYLYDMRYNFGVEIQKS